MKTAPSGVSTSLANDHSIEVGTTVYAEWQLNRFYRTSVDNTPSEDSAGYDIEIFPIESITKTNRPVKSGIVKAVVGQAMVASNHYDSVPSARYYTCSVDSQYKYWQSPESAAPTTFAMSNCAPQVVYVQEDDVSGSPVPMTVTANKIYFTVENTYAHPTDYDVQVKYTTGGSWTTVSSDVTIPATGRVELWWNGSSWTTTKNVAHTRTVSAVRLVINTMNKQAFFNLIELGLALELDLSDDVSTWNDQMSMGEPDFITPLGLISSNTASVTLFNDSQTYTKSNASSLLYGLMDKGVIFRAWVSYNGNPVQEFEMFSDVWSEAEDSTTVSLIDGSSFFMEAKPRSVLYRNVSVQEAVWRICDIIGFNNYNVTTLDTDPHSVIDIFWTDGEKTAWELFGELSRATQTAIYFDSFGVLQVRTRGAAWDSAQAPSYTFIRDSVPGGQPSNIVTLVPQTQYEANKVNINWMPTGFSERVSNVVPFEVVWEPDGTVVLRSTPLESDLLVAATELNLAGKAAKTWPWSGMCQVEGEWISFDAKRYVYYDENDIRQTGWVTDYDAQKRIDAKTDPNLLHLNSYTGVLRIKERGLFNTEEQDHFIGLNNWTKSRRRNYGTATSPCPGISLNSSQSNLTISTPKNSKIDDYTYLHRGNAIDDGYYYVGTRLKIDKSSHKDKVGGIFFNGDDGLGSGYYVEVMATSRMNGKMRNTRNEVIFYSMKSDGSKKIIGGEQVNIKDKSQNHKKDATVKHDIGSALAVPANRFIDIDVWLRPSGADDKVQVWANGSLLFEVTVSGTWKHTKVSRSGLYARGNSSVTFDYFYGISNLNSDIDPIDGESYFDRIDGAYRGNQIMKDWVYETRIVRRRVRRRWTLVEQKYNQRFYDDFGPMVHEVREFNVKFTSDTPVLESKLYSSNNSQVVCTEFVGDISGAHFIMANIDRRDAVVSGDDDVTSLGNGTINQKLFVYGRPVIQKDEQTITKEDAWAQRRRGVIEIDYSSNWIQNEDEANRFADWLTSHWSGSDVTAEAEVFGNNLIEISDTVDVTFNDLDAVFYVIGISNTFENGLTTNLTLRKAYDN